MLLYIHIPFCDVKCPYCAFSSFVNKLDYQKVYIDALITHFDYEVERLGIKVQSISSVFIGGGTPSMLEVKYLSLLIKHIQKYLKANIEITIEANPNSATYEWLSYAYGLGINRVSFGVQSFDVEKLKFLGRIHTRSEGIAAINNANKAGFDNISLDLIYECANDTIELLKSDLDIATALPINHISAYSLTLEPKTAF